MDISTNPGLTNLAVADSGAKVKDIGVRVAKLMDFGA